MNDILLGFLSRLVILTHLRYTRRTKSQDLGQLLCSNTPPQTGEYERRTPNLNLDRQDARGKFQAGFAVLAWYCSTLGWFSGFSRG